MQNRRLNIFIGPIDNCKIGGTLAVAFRKLGHKVTAASVDLDPTLDGMKYDVVLHFAGLNAMQKFFRYLPYFVIFFLRHNVFIFQCGVSLLPCNLDLPVLKLFRKKTIMWFFGSDIRHYESLEAASKKAGIKYYFSKDQGMGQAAFKKKLRMIHRVEKYADYIFSSPHYSQLLTREYVFIYNLLDIDNIIYNNIPNRNTIIVHAPTDDRVKGTSYILQAVKRLKREGYSFDFRLLRDRSNTEVLKTLSEADIAIDQLLDTAPGIFATEAMAAGCAVLGGSNPEFAGLPRELPIIHTDPDNIYENLKMLLEKPGLRQDLGEKGRYM